MNPQADVPQGLHLPQPTAHAGALNAQQPVATTPADMPVPASPPQRAASRPSPPLAGQQDEAAAALLDEEWVAKAKEVVMQTSADPYTQNKELARVKAQYLRARYGKDIKIGKD